MKIRWVACFMDAGRQVGIAGAVDRFSHGAIIPRHKFSEAYRRSAQAEVRRVLAEKVARTTSSDPS